MPGTYRIADYEVFLIYLVNEQDYIMSALLPMGEYDNLYALKGIICRVPVADKRGNRLGIFVHAKAVELV